MKRIHSVCRRRNVSQQPRGRDGFTLVEILIVVSIISLLAGMILVGVQAARTKASASMTSTNIGKWVQALESYYQDEGKYPAQGEDVDATANHFPAVYNAICGQPRPKGPGGRGAPYYEPPEDKIYVYDDSTEEYRPATRQERFDVEVDKYVVDDFGQPFVYRCNKGEDLAVHTFMHNSNYDLYSIGEDGEDQTMLGDELGEDEENDDIGNW